MVLVYQVILKPIDFSINRAAPVVFIDWSYDVVRRFFSVPRNGIVVLSASDDEYFKWIIRRIYFLYNKNIK